MILGASGGVGTACVMLCKIAGAHVIAAAGTDEKCRRLVELGADDTINYSEVDFVKHIREATGRERDLRKVTNEACGGCRGESSAVGR